MKSIDKYYEYILKNKRFSKEEEIVFEIMKDFTDRRGLKQEWSQIDEDIQEEIIQTWIKIIKLKLNLDKNNNEKQYNSKRISIRM